MRRIAQRLADADGESAHNCSVDRLSRASAALGGPSKLTIIAHSSGGLIARYYLTRKTEDEFGTRYRGNVGQVIFLGTPHRGVDIEDLLDPLPTNLLIYRLMVRVHYLFPPEFHEQSKSLRTEFRELQQATKGAFFGDKPESAAETPAFKQMHPGSDFITDINSPGRMPSDIEYHNIVGDIRAGAHVKALGRTFIDGTKSFGDLLVSTFSAGSMPNAPSECYPLLDEYCLDVDIGRRISQVARLEKNADGPLPIHRHLRSLPQARTRMLEILRRRGEIGSSGAVEEEEKLATG
jgi:hypothetical protein